MRILSYNTNLRYLKFKKCISMLPSNAILSCPALEAVDMTELTSIPSVTSSTLLTTMINQMHPNVKFYVNDDLYNQFISETNWTSISSHIVGVKLNDN